ncbi:hypothetical protein FHR70_000668 [Microvirga lupini]|uniref:Uncharacterized protein n=1 Tax=Microvirga lupini TaxID=420324 RepID=A0A7W4VI29_9HYPH|nr:hypothetical protein [Microvirga lupini]MBB3017628.1 hypothetical protein [Microvirga lupini]
MDKSAAQRRIEAQCAGASAPFDTDEAMRLLRQAKIIVSRHPTIGAQKLANEINTFTAAHSNA